MDYFDGKLSEESTQALYAFLQQHPDLREEFESYEEIKLVEPESEKYPDKDNLKKPNATTAGNINAFNFEDFLIARQEGDLAKNEAETLSLFLQKNPHLRSYARFYESATFKPAKDITYPDKENLKKTIAPFLVRNKKTAFFAMAASVLLLIGLFFFRNDGTERIKSVNRIAQITVDEVHYQSARESIRFRNTKTELPDMIAPEQPTLQTINSLASIPIPSRLQEKNNEIAMSKRLEQTSNYHYSTIMDDLEYYVALQEYQKKGPLGKFFYQVENRLSASEMYIAEPVLNPVRFDRESFSSLSNFSFTQLLDMMPEQGRFRADGL
ncbi:MAG: hypothetical protein ACQESX_06210 [Bacteroidota bacterium]